MAELKIKADSGGGTVSWKGPSTTTGNAAVQLTLPVDDGAADQYLKTDGSGALSWATVSTGIADTHQSVAKAWVNFNGDCTVAINQDYGVSSITDHGTGDFTINFDSNFADNDYCFVGMAENGEGTSNHDSHTIISGYYGGQAVGSFRLATLRTRFDQEPPQFQDCAATCVAFFR